MTSHTTVPTLLNRPMEMCPRCAATDFICLVAHVESLFVWYECDECEYLWAVPRSWTSRADVMHRSATHDGLSIPRSVTC